MNDNVKRIITEAVNEEYSNNSYADYCKAFTCAVNRLMGYYGEQGNIPVECLQYASEYSKSKWFQ